MQCILKIVGVHAETKNIFLIPIIAFIIGILWFLFIEKDTSVKKVHYYF